MNTRSTIIVVLLALGFIAVGYAEELEHSGNRKSVLFSPALWINDGTRTECTVVNVSDRPRKITIQIFRGITAEDVTEGSECGDIAVLPGTACVADYTNRTNGVDIVYCKVTVNGSKGTVRGVFAIPGTCDETCQTSVPVDVR
jgi:hypothetical protein